MAVETRDGPVLYGVRPWEDYWHAVDEVTYDYMGDVSEVKTRCGKRYAYDDVGTWAYDYSWEYAIGGCNKYCNYSVEVIGPWNPEQSK